jgi:PAS domain S-box-containing protein
MELETKIGTKVPVPPLDPLPGGSPQRGDPRSHPGVPGGDAPEPFRTSDADACDDELFEAEVARILVVDGNPVTLQSVARHLEQTPYRVLTATRGAEALRLLEADSPSVVISNWSIPGMSGLEFCRAVQTSPGAGFIHLIVLTSDTTRAHHADAINAGASDVLTQPVDRDELVARVNAGMRIVRLEADLANKVRERRQADEELQRAHAHTKQILESMPSLVISVDAAGNVVEWNETAGHVLGIPGYDTLGVRFDELDIPWDRPAIARAVAESAHTKQPVRIDELAMRRPDGTDGVLDVTVTPIETFFDMDGAFLLVGSDITARKHAECELALAAQHQVAVNDLQQDLLGPGALVDKLNKITAAAVRLFNADFCRIWAIQPGDLCGSGCVHAGVTDGPHICRRRDRCLHLMSSSGRYTHTDGAGHRRVPFGCYKIGRVASGEDHKFVTNAVTTDSRVHNHEWAKTLGLVAFAGYQLRPPGGQAVGVLAMFSMHAVTPEIDAMLESLANTATQVIQSAAAEERQRNLQNQLAHAQRLKSVGQLAGGIAHEINTPMQFVGDNTRFLQCAFPKLQILLAKHARLMTACRAGPVPPHLLDELEVATRSTDLNGMFEQIPEALADSLDGVEHVTKIVRAMKDFASGDEQGIQAVDLNRAIESTVTVASNEWRYLADLRLDLDPTLPPVPCRLADFNQVVLNLIVNAVHAIADVVGRDSGAKGTITVTTRQNGEEVEVCIADTGTGIPEVYRDRIFEHFFTTKEVGQGTGQGLAIARQVIVDKHKGSLTFETEVGKGTTFIIRLPLAPAEAGAGGVAAAGPSERARCRGPEGEPA